MGRSKHGVIIPIFNCRGEKKNLIYPCYGEYKYDGMYAFYDDGIFYTKYGKEKPFSLAGDEMFRSLDIKLLGEIVWDCGKRGELYDLLKHNHSPNFNFIVFDVIEYNGKTTRSMSYEKRRELLCDIISPEYEHIKLAHMTRLNDRMELDDFFKLSEEFGYEGIVVKNGHSALIGPNQRWVKLKHKDTADLEVLNIDQTRDRIEVRVNAEKVCGVKTTHKQRRGLKRGDIVEVEYQGILSGSGLRHPVFIRPRNDKKVADVL